jgi:hypothetical protein
MSNPPSGYNTPKTNWQSADVVLPTDLNRIEGNINAIETGSRTIDPAQSPSGNSGSLRQWLDWFPNMVKKITGKTNWYDTPDTTLAAAKTHIDATSAHSATSAAAANRIILRDASGRAQVASPSAAADIATKGYVDSAVPSLVASSSLVLISAPSQITLRPYPTAHRQFQVLCKGTYRVTFEYIPTDYPRDAIIYLYRIRSGTGTLVKSWTYSVSSWPNWLSASIDVTSCLPGDYLGFYCYDQTGSYAYGAVRNVSIQASIIVQTS